ncbi:hypothetical protein GOB94_05625 [Granulicella sp. 5B5]|nr:hypothetical protein GOB94_05625 [Granulicella sp. 5B5]
MSITVLWAVITVSFIIVMIYRASLSNHETDQLFLNETTPSSVHQENDEVVRRLNSLAPICKGLGGVTILLTLLAGGMWIVHTLPTN